MLKSGKQASKIKKKTSNKNSSLSWSKAVKRSGIFEGRNAAIMLICRKEICPTCNDGRLVTPIKWKILTKKGGKWTKVEEHPYNCDVDKIFSKYGQPAEFITSCGSYEDKDVIKPEKVY